MCSKFPEDSRTLILAAVILACILIKDQSAEEIGRTAAFFTVLGDALALLALDPCLLQSTQEELSQ
ncbi:MAG: hypothetical protein J6A62_06480 [Oscillospiraceae bacterium]|nr:hypothetical protein [Oscillospiraceae bacterium]